MKTQFFYILLCFIFLQSNINFATANPFVSRLQKSIPASSKKKDHPIIYYLGYLQISGKYHGIIQFKNNQLIVNESDSLGKVIITKIGRTYLKYQFKNKEYIVKVAQNLD